MNRKILLETKEKRAISPIIATLLLILIAIAAGVVVYAYVLGFIGNSINQNGTGPSSESLTINAWVVESNDTSVLIFVQNTGSNPINITSAFFYNSAGSLLTQNTTLAGYGSTHGAGVIVNSGATGSVYVKGVSGFVKGQSYQAKVVTTLGGSATTALQKA